MNESITYTAYGLWDMRPTELLLSGALYSVRKKRSRSDHLTKQNRITKLNSNSRLAHSPIGQTSPMLRSSSNLVT